MKHTNEMNSSTAFIPTVFIIEDSITDCLLMTNALQHTGYVVRSATDGHEGLSTVLAHPPQCLILDLVLPGLSGYAICRQVRAVDSRHTIPIIVVSTKKTALDQRYALGLGVDRYLPKPFSAETLIQTVWEVLPGHLRSLVAPPPQQDMPQRGIVREEAVVMAEDQRLLLSSATTALQAPAHRMALEQQSVLTLSDLIPRRKHNAEFLRSSNPFAHSATFSDEQARLLYAAIDGHKNVAKLCISTGMDLREVSTVLQTLLAQQRIELYEPGGQLVTLSLFLTKS